MDYRYTAPVALPLISPPRDEMPSPPITVHGNGLSEYVYAKTLAKTHYTRWIMVSGGLLLWLFGIAAAGYATVYGDAAESAFLWALLVVAMMVGLVGRHYRRQTIVRADICARRLYAAAVKGGVTTTVYPDRLEQRSARWKQTIVFNEQARFVENVDWFMVENGDNRVIVAASDVTPWEAQTMFEHIARAIPPARQFSDGRFVARREQTAPPPFSMEPPVCYERVEYQEPHGRFVWPRGLLPWLFAIAMVVSSMFTVLFACTASFFIDYLIYFTACFAGVFAASLLVLHQQKEKNPARVTALSFTSEGLLIEKTDGETFAAAIDIHARRTADGVRLFTPAGVFTVPWSSVTYRQQLEWMLFQQRPTSFQ